MVLIPFSDNTECNIPSPFIIVLMLWSLLLGPGAVPTDTTLSNRKDLRSRYILEMPRNWEVILFYNGLDIPTRQILDSRGAIPTKTAEDAKKAIQEMAEYSQKWHNGTSRGRSTETSDGLAAIQAQLNNLGREIKKVNEKVYAAQVGCEQCKGPHYTKDCPQKEEGKTLEEAYYTQFGGPFQGGGYRATTPAKRHEENSNLIKEIRAMTNVAIRNQGASIKTLEIQIGQMSKITLRVGEEKIIFKSVKPASSITKRVYMLSLRERMELDLEARLMEETLVLNRSLDPFLEYYIELNDLNEPFELRRNQGDDLMPTIEEGEVIEEFRTRDEDLDIGIDDYPSYCDDHKKIHIDWAHNLKFSCMIGFEFTHVNFYSLLYVNVMSRKFHNSIMKNKMVYKGDNVVGALMNVPIFVGTFFVMTDFAVLEDMDAYRDEGMGDIIVGEPFLREVRIKAKCFKEDIYPLLMVKMKVRLHPFLDLFFLLKMAKDTIDIVMSVLTQKELDAFCVKYNITANLRLELPGHDDMIRNSPEGKIGILSPRTMLSLNLMKRLNEGCAAIIKYLEMGLLDFVKSFDSFKVKVGERTLAEGEVPLSKKTEDMVISPSRDIIRIVDHTIVDELKSVVGKKKKRVAFNDDLLPVKKAKGSSYAAPHKENPTTAGKTPAVLQKLLTHNVLEGVGSGSAATAMDAFISSSVTPSPDREYQDESGSTQGDNVITFLTVDRFVVISSSPPSLEHVDTESSYLKYASPAPHVQTEAVVVTAVPAHKADASSVLAHEAGTSFVPGPEAGTSSSAPGDGSPANEFYDSQTIDSSTAKDIYIPNRDVTNDFRMNDDVICQNFFDHVPPPGYWTSLRNLTNAEFLDQFNANSAQHACMVLELRLRYEHEIEMRERFEKKFVMSVAGIKRRRRDPSSDDVRDLVTALGRGRLNEDLESST
ncbi:hypothetical protein Tco_0792437 [Tanacetum coccineum]